MNKNKIINIISISTSIFAVSAIIAFSVFVGIHYKEKNAIVFDTDQGSDNMIASLGKKHKVSKGDVLDYVDTKGKYKDGQNQIETFPFSIDSQFKAGDEFTINDVLYNDGFNDIHPRNNGVVLETKNNEFTVYYYNDFVFSVELSSEEYYKTSERNNYYCKVNGEYHKLVLDTYDLTTANSSGGFKANFISNDINQILTKDSFQGIFRLDCTYQNVFYVDSSAFGGEFLQYFGYVVGNDINYVLIECTKLLNDYAIIECMETNLNNVEFIYEI